MASQRDAMGRVRAWVARHGGITLLEGKQVLELSVASRNKGDAIHDLARDMDGVLFIGDDTTDETVFETLGDTDVGVKVGDGDTSARYRVPGVAEVVDLLEQVALALGSMSMITSRRARRQSRPTVLA
jgi:trehalose 6-phosphate phosphatase